MLVFSLLFAVVGSLSVLREPVSDASGTLSGGTPGSFSIMDGAVVRNNRGGKKQWDLLSRKMRIEGDIVDLEDVDALVSSLHMKVTAPEGRYHLGSGGLWLSRGVLMASSDYRINADSVFLDPDLRELRSEDRVELDARGMRLTGLGLVVRDGQIEVKDDVKAILY